MSYRRLVTRPMGVWALVALTARLPGAMAPLAMVFLGHGAVGGYARGSVLAALFIAGEVVGAALLGTLVHPRRLRTGLAVGLLCGAAGFAYFVVAPDSSIAALGLAAFVAGSGPALSPGALRTLLTGIVAEEDVPKAFSADAILTELVWMLAPALVVLLALQVGPHAPLAVCAVSMAVAAVMAGRLAPTAATTEDEGRRPPLRVVLSGWPVYLTSAAALSLMAVSELVLPALLEHRGHPVGLAGVLLTVFGGVSVLTSFLYGLRSGWPGTARTQSLVFLLATAACVAAFALVPGLPWIVVFFLVSGCCQPIVLITRNLTLRERLPESAHTAGYSVMYAVQGLGYSLAAVLAGIALDSSNPTAAVLVGVTMTLVLTVVSLLGEGKGDRADTTNASRPTEGSQQCV
jgi:hypothetical protein